LGSAFTLRGNGGKPIPVTPAAGPFCFGNLRL